MTSHVDTEEKIFVAGHRGMMGQAIIRALARRGYHAFVTRSRQELDLLDQAAVARFLREERPKTVFVAAAKVGGIVANNTYRADFIYENLQIQNNVIWGSHLADVDTVVFLGSSCIYPRLAPQPMSERELLSGPLEVTNRPYAIAKIAGLELINTLRQQYGRSYFSVMPTNLYGPGDNFHPENSHVLPALVRRFLEAQRDERPEVTVWGSGSPKREFLHADDCADAIVFLKERLLSSVFEQSSIVKAGWSHINVGSGAEIAIGDLARLVAELVGYKGRIVFDKEKPDGTPRKLLDCSYLRELGWNPRIPLREGLEETIAAYRSQFLAS